MLGESSPNLYMKIIDLLGMITVLNSTSLRLSKKEEENVQALISLTQPQAPSQKRDITFITQGLLHQVSILVFSLLHFSFLFFSYIGRSRVWDLGYLVRAKLHLEGISKWTSLWG